MCHLPFVFNLISFPSFSLSHPPYYCCMVANPQPQAARCAGIPLENSWTPLLKTHTHIEKYTYIHGDIKRACTLTHTHADINIFLHTCMSFCVTAPHVSSLYVLTLRDLGILSFSSLQAAQRHAKRLLVLDIHLDNHTFRRSMSL